MMAKDEKKKKCFIIMPITTPSHLVDQYSGGKDHFKHVLKSLHIPAVRQAGLEPISPKSKGSEVIQADIINNLDGSDLILCDISALNANVFFEVGIRTALDKAVCFVKDEMTKIPFDTGLINHEDYSSALEGWNIDADRTKVAKHISDTLEGNDGHNPLWKRFGLTSAAKMVEPQEGLAGQVQILTEEIATLKNSMQKPQGAPTITKHTRDRVHQIARKFAVDILGMHITGNKMFVAVSGATKDIYEFRKFAGNKAKASGFSLIVNDDLVDLGI